MSTISYKMDHAYTIQLSLRMYGQLLSHYKWLNRDRVDRTTLNRDRVVHNYVGKPHSPSLVPRLFHGKSEPNK